MPKQATIYDKRITIRVSSKLIDAIDGERSVRGQSVAQLLREVLHRHFGLT